MSLVIVLLNYKNRWIWLFYLTCLFQM